MNSLITHHKRETPPFLAAIRLHVQLSINIVIIFNFNPTIKFCQHIKDLSIYILYVPSFERIHHFLALTHILVLT